MLGLLIVGPFSVSKSGAEGYCQVGDYCFLCWKLFYFVCLISEAEIPEGWVSGGRGQTLFSGAQRQDKGQWAPTEAEEAPAEHEEELLPSEVTLLRQGGQTR